MPLLANEPIPGRFEKRAAVGDAGQRVDHGRRLVAQLGTLFRHREQDEGDGDREQQRFEAQHREPNAARRPGWSATTAAMRRAACAAGTAHRARTA